MTVSVTGRYFRNNELVGTLQPQGMNQSMIKNKDLLSIFSSMDEEDNPILVFYTLKKTTMKQTTVYILLLLLTACQSKDRLDMALEYAGDNRAELEKVLEHYRGDEMKYRAARFLIENMVGHTGHDSTDVRKFQPFYDRHVAISKKYNWERPAEWQQEIDSIWKKSGQSLFFPKSRCANHAGRPVDTGDDRSFKAWQENAYTRNAPFEDFCRYILPYRYAEGVCIDNSRDVFYQRHAHLFSDAGRTSGR